MTTTDQPGQQASPAAIPTPRTDALTNGREMSGGPEIELRDHARQLERELIESQTACGELLARLENLLKTADHYESQRHIAGPQGVREALDELIGAQFEARAAIANATGRAR